MPTFIGAGPFANRVAGGGIGFGANGSVLLDGSKILTNVTGAILGFANSWSASVWTKPVSPSVMDIMGFGDGASQNTVRMVYNGVPEYSAVNFSDASGIIKLYRYATAIQDSVWQHYIMTWDGTLFTLYYQGVETARTAATVNNTGTMDDSNLRSIILGARIEDFGSNPLVGNIGHAAIWDTVLDGDDAGEIFDGKHVIDLRTNTGGYDKASNLVHYYRPGYDSQGREDLAGSYDLVDSTTTDGDIVEDAPA